jgi:hypothetical protein
MNKKLFKSNYLSLITALILCFFTFSCGTILHPERKGQVSGKIDPGIAVLNGIGLLFFLVPGVIAFAVDFSNGTIYLPNGNYSDSDYKNSITKMTKIKTQEILTPDKIEKIVEQHTGCKIDLASAEIQAQSIR